MDSTLMHPALDKAIAAARGALAARDQETLRSLAQSTLGRCVLGLAGYLEFTVTELQRFLREPAPAEDALQRVEELLLLLADAVADEDNAIFIARIGAHPLLLRLMNHEHDGIQDAAAQVVASCSSSQLMLSGLSFPHRARVVGDVVRAEPLVVQLPEDSRDGVQSHAVLVRQVPTRMTGQPKTGYLLWGAARVLARWLHVHRELIDGKSVLEVGSGLGLAGIVAARYAARTILTDYQEDTCTALSYNVALNAGFTHGSEDASKAAVAVEMLDWDSLESIRGPTGAPKPKVDIIIGCDIICEPSTADGFLRVVRERLNAHGVAYLINADAHSRFGVAYLHDALRQSDLVYSITKVDELPDGPVLLDTVHDSKELRYEYYEIRLPPTATC